MNSSQTTTDSDTLSNIGNAGTGGSFTIAETNNSSATITEIANTVVGNSTQTTTSSDTNALSSVGNALSGVPPTVTASFTLSSSDTNSGTATEVSNSITGSLSAASNETHSTSLTQIGVNSGGSYTLTATTSESPSTSETGDSITGGFTFTQTATQSYSFNESGLSGTSVYTISEDGTKGYTLTQDGSHVSGAYTLSDAGHDAYTVNETGGTQNVSMGVSGTWGQSLSGGDNYDTTETGNELSGFFTRTTTGSGTDVLSETGSIAGMPYNNTPATAYTLSETGNYLSGSLSMSETGEDRHSIIQVFDNTSNATTHNGPGIVDYSPVGAPFRVGGLTTAYAGPGITGQLNAAATDAAFNDLGLGLLHEYCWRGTTYVWVADNPRNPRRPVLKRITDVVAGDKVLSPSDRDPHGPPAWKTVERVFKNKPAELWCLKTDRGNEVFPTANHRIYVVERNWSAAAELKRGDPLLSVNGKSVRVASVAATGIIEEVYNLQVEGNRTYYVSDGTEGCSLLAHNASDAQQTFKIGGIEGYREGDKVFITGIAGQRFGPKDLYNDSQIPLQLRLAIEDVLAGQPGVAIHYHGPVTDANGNPQAQYTIVRGDPNEVRRGGSPETKHVTGPASSSDYNGIRDRQRQDSDQTDKMLGALENGMEAAEKLGDLADALKGTPGLNKGVKKGAQVGVKKVVPKAVQFGQKVIKKIDDAVNNRSRGGNPAPAKSDARSKKTTGQTPTKQKNSSTPAPTSNPGTGRLDTIHSGPTAHDRALESARKNAGDLGKDTQKMYDPATGTLIGERSADGKRGWRIDDGHVNWWDWKGGKKGDGGRFGHEYFPSEQGGPHSKFKGYAPYQ